MTWLGWGWGSEGRGPMGHLGRGGRGGSLCWPHALHHDPATPRPGLSPKHSPAVPPQSGRADIPGWGPGGDPGGVGEGVSALQGASCPQHPQPPREGWAGEGRGPWALFPPAPSPESGLLQPPRAFILLAAEVGLWVILRPGPYICSEVDLGGLPR